MNLEKKIEADPNLSPFRKKVLSALLLIPKGRVSTYKLLAEHLDCHSAQAIGQALKHNPLAPAVPCHRIIRTDLSIGGFMGKRSGDPISRKFELLKEEGVSFDQNGYMINNEPFHFPK